VQIRLLLTLLLVAAFPLEGSVSSGATAPSSRKRRHPATRRRAARKLPGVVTFESASGMYFSRTKCTRNGLLELPSPDSCQDPGYLHEEYLTYSPVNGDCHDADTAISTTYYGCDHCHHSNLENIADETLTAKVVIHKSCWNCHLSGNGAEASERCSFCHQKEEQELEVSQETAGH
jgi:hypothetical protein